MRIGRRKKFHRKKGRKQGGKDFKSIDTLIRENIPKKRKFNGKTYYLSLVGTKADAKHSEKLHKELGYEVKVTKEEIGLLGELFGSVVYAVWARKKRK